MSLVTGITLPNNGDRIKVENYNDPITKILAQVNGNLDAANIAAGSLPWEAMASFTNKIPASAMQDSANLEKYRNEEAVSFIATGLIWSALSGLNAQMTTGIYYSRTGARLSVAAIASRTFLASRDTYVYVDQTGAIGYLDVANNAARPNLPSNSNWLALIVAGASAITSVTDLRQTAFVAGRNIDFASLVAAQQAWQTLAYQNGWVDYDPVTFYGLRYMKDSNGFVHLTGLVKNGTVSTTIATLPVGYRPAKEQRFLTPNGSTQGIGAVSVLSTGAINQNNLVNPNNSFVFLDGISFRAEG